MINTLWVMSWTPEQLALVDAARELDIAVRRADGTLQPWTPIWAVHVVNDVYVRTCFRDAGWFGGDGLNVRQLAKVLVKARPEQALRDAYIESLTGSSLQSQSQVTASLAALGLQGERQLFRDSQSLNALFKARNQIAHEMDMTPAGATGQGNRTRHE